MYLVALFAGSWLAEFWQAFCTKFAEAFKPGLRNGKMVIIP